MTAINIGEVFTLLTVLCPCDNIHGRKAFYCQCQCGNRKEVMAKSLRAGRTKSCGCLRSMAGLAHMALEYKEYIGKVFDRLTVIEYICEKPGKRAHLLCQCTCGDQKVIPARRLVTGQVKSCGCMLRERRKK